jgi:Tfp pilus assembly protein PilV
MSTSKCPDSRWIPENSQGFILLEVLVAMSMILGVWIISVEAYQRLALSLVQQDSTRSQLRKEFDAFELQEHTRANVNLPGKGLNHDSTRVSRRNRSVLTTSQSTLKDKR